MRKNRVVWVLGQIRMGKVVLFLSFPQTFLSTYGQGCFLCTIKIKIKTNLSCHPGCWAYPHIVKQCPLEGEVSEKPLGPCISLVQLLVRLWSWLSYLESLTMFAVSTGKEPRDHRAQPSCLHIIKLRPSLINQCAWTQTDGRQPSSGLCVLGVPFYFILLDIHTAPRRLSGVVTNAWSGKEETWYLMVWLHCVPLHLGSFHQWFYSKNWLNSLLSSDVP